MDIQSYTDYVFFSLMSFDRLYFPRNLSISSVLKCTDIKSFIVLPYYPCNICGTSNDTASFIFGISKMYLHLLFNRSGYWFITFTAIFKELSINFIDFIFFRAFCFLDFCSDLGYFVSSTLNFICPSFSSFSSWKLRAFIGDFSP